MRPRPEEPNTSLCVLTGEGMTIQEVEDIVRTKNFHGFPGNFVSYFSNIISNFISRGNKAMYAAYWICFQ